MSESQFCAIAPVPNSCTRISWRIRETRPRSHLNDTRSARHCRRCSRT